jgi:hypothetical protein
MTFNDVRFNYGFKVQFFPVLRSFLQHCLQVRLTGDDLACGFGSFPQDAGQYDDRLSGDLVVKSRDYGVVALKALAWNLPLMRPDPLSRSSSRESQNLRFVMSEASQVLSLQS